MNSGFLPGPTPVKSKWPHCCKLFFPVITNRPARFEFQPLPLFLRFRFCNVIIHSSPTLSPVLQLALHTSLQSLTMYTNNCFFMEEHLAVPVLSTSLSRLPTSWLTIRFHKFQVLYSFSTFYPGKADSSRSNMNGDSWNKKDAGRSNTFGITVGIPKASENSSSPTTFYWNHSTVFLEQLILQISFLVFFSAIAASYKFWPSRRKEIRSEKSQPCKLCSKGGSHLPPSSRKSFDVLSVSCTLTSVQEQTWAAVRDSRYGSPP